MALDPQEHLGVDGLRAGVPAPQPTGHRREEEQRQRRDHQQRGQVDEVLWLQHQAEHEEAPFAQVEQHRLAVVPLQPRQAVEHGLCQQDHQPAPGGEPAAHGARIDADLFLVGRKQPFATVLGQDGYHPRWWRPIHVYRAQADALSETMKSMTMAPGSR
jgi:hypothetical protein